MDRKNQMQTLKSFLEAEIPNDIELVLIGSDRNPYYDGLIGYYNKYKMHNDEYKKALYNAQTTGDISDLVNIFKLCQERLDKKLSKYQTYIDNINNDRYITNNIEDDLDDIDY